MIFSLCNRMILGFRGPPSGEATIVLVFGGSSSTGLSRSFLVAYDGLILPSALPDFFATVLWVDSNYCSSHIASLILLVV